MSVVAVIPARGGSVGVPGKNLRTIGGIPLVARAVLACRAARRIDEIFVSTDDAGIAEAARAAGARIIERPADLADNTASSESALLHGLDEIADLGIDAQVLVFVQCTSPFISGADLDTGVELVTSGRADSCFSGVETFEFLWRDADETQEAGTAEMVGQNHDASSRPRRQDRRPDYRETGAFYVMRTDGFRASRHRFFGRTRVVKVSELASLEIDTAEELAVADAFAGVLDRPGPGLGQPVEVDAVITDFDGVHTPDTAAVDEHGHEFVTVSRSDGMGVSLLRQTPVHFLILSRERNRVVTARAEKLGVPVLQAVDDKARAVAAWAQEQGVPLERVAYLGNDVNDLGAMQLVGWPVAVADAHRTVKERARVVLTRAGGHGAVRELCELVLAARPEGAKISERISHS